MLLTLPKLKELVAKLETARRDATAPGQGTYCATPNVVDGQTTRWEPKPRSKRPVGHVYPDGTKLEQGNDGLGIRVPLGVHGRAFLAVDTETGEVRCGKCWQSVRWQSQVGLASAAANVPVAHPGEGEATR